MFGPHLIIDGSRCDTRKLADRILVEQILNDYPAAIGMTKIGGPYMFEYQAPDPAYSGVSGLVVIAESHIAIHTFPALDYFTMDIFSCKNFDHEVAIEYIKQAFDVQEMDRMLVQRGLSFRGPHHGKQGATDELIAAAEARLAAGVISNEPALPDASPTASQAELRDERAAAAARRDARSSDAADPDVGRMLWPQYGVTPDYGTFGPTAAVRAAATGARVVALPQPAFTANGADGYVPAREPVQVNPTASISGLLDKLSATSGQGRMLGQSLAAWERMVRDPSALIALVLSTPVVAAGMRELLVYAIEHRYVDVIITSADDLFADLYESLGYTYRDDGGPDAMQTEGRERTLAFFTEFATRHESASLSSPADLWRRLGLALPTHAPRKGLLQAAAQGMRVFTPDLATSALGTALLAAQAGGGAITLDTAEAPVMLARLLAQAPVLGVIQVGIGSADALLAQARALMPLLALAAPERLGHVVIGTAAGTSDGLLALPTDPTLALPLLVTGLAQRCPAIRERVAVPAEALDAPDGEPALA